MLNNSRKLILRNIKIYNNVWTLNIKWPFSKFLNSNINSNVAVTKEWWNVYSEAGQWERWAGEVIGAREFLGLTPKSSPAEPKDGFE